MSTVSGTVSLDKKSDSVPATGYQNLQLDYLLLPFR
jgi:hypothetical protein